MKQRRIEVTQELARTSFGLQPESLVVHAAINNRGHLELLVIGEGDDLSEFSIPRIERLRQ